LPKFRTRLHQSGKNTTGIIVPEEVVTALDAGKKPPVRVSIGGYAYRSTIGSMGGQFMIPVSAEHRGGAGISGGDEIEVEVELDTAPRDVAAPPDLAAALAADPAAEAAFRALSNSNKSRIVLSLEGAKTAETRQRRLEKALIELGGG